MPEVIVSNASEFKKNNGIPEGIKIPVQNEYRYTKDQLNNLKNLLQKTQKAEEQQEIVNKFFSEKEGIKTETIDETTYLKEVLANLTIDNLKKSLDVIEKEKTSESRGLLTNLMLGALEAKGYRVRLEDKGVVLEGIGQDDKRLEFETVLNNYINRNKFNFENLKTAILCRTTKIDDYLKMNSDSKGIPLVDKIDAKRYYEFLLKKYDMDYLIVTKGDIKSNGKIDPKDKDFMLSYKEDAFDDYPIGTAMKQYAIDTEARKSAAPKAEQAIAASLAGLPPEARTKAEAALKKDPRNINERIGDFVKDPFSEIMKISSSAGPIGGLAVIGALIYFAWTEPKKVFGGIAGWGLAKGTGIADYLGDEFGAYTKNNPKDEKKEEKKDEKKDTKKKPETKTENLSEGQKKATARVMNDKGFVELTKNFSEKNKNGKNGKIEEYLNFINSPDFQSKSVNTIFYSKDASQSMFSNESNLEGSIVLPENLDPVTFKKIFRMYLTGQYRLDETQNTLGTKEFKGFETKFLAKGVSKDKSLKTIVDQIYSK